MGFSLFKRFRKDQTQGEKQSRIGPAGKCFQDPSVDLKAANTTPPKPGAPVYPGDGLYGGANRGSQYQGGVGGYQAQMANGGFSG